MDFNESYLDSQDNFMGITRRRLHGKLEFRSREFHPAQQATLSHTPLSTRFFYFLNRLYSCYSDHKLTFHYPLSSGSTLSYSLRKLVHITRFKPLTIIQNESYLRGRYENTCSPRNDGPLQEGAVLTACDSLFFFFFFIFRSGIVTVFQAVSMR
jgi:hypothetical protein